MKIVTAAQMRELDRRAVAAGVPSLTLMERAGEGLLAIAADMLETTAGRRVVVVAGKGNNGGDGCVVARLLAQAGARVQVFLAGEPGEVSGDARANLDRLAEVGVDARPVKQGAEVAPALATADLIVDALLGTGAAGELHGLIAELVTAINAAGRPVLAADVPTGLDADSGQVANTAVEATCTGAMGLPKIGLLLYPGVNYTGRLRVVDVGLPPKVVESAEPAAEMLDGSLVRSWLPRRSRGAHKGDFGRVLVIAGSVGFTGAAALCADAALRAGAGLVTLGAPESLNDILEVKLTEVMTHPLPETPARALSGAALEPILELAERSDAVAIGPGLSRHPATAELVRTLVTRLPRPMVVDADGLNALAEDTAALEGRHAPIILTPHPGEMGRLLGLTPGEVQRDRLTAAATAAERFHAVVVLKGAGTVVARAGELPRINPTGNPGMASGGTGDVLTGLVAGLLGQGLDPYEAAGAAVYLHGLAGDLAAAELGEACLIAGDLLGWLPEAFREVIEGVA